MYFSHCVHVCLFVQMKQLVPAAPPCLVFLDLAWPGSAPCRVLIRLDRDTTLGRQFILMCTGQRGTSYINTNLFRVWDDGRGRWRGVIGGDYQHNNGKGGAALLNLGSCQYMSLCHAGDVFWRSSGPSKGTQFHIITKASVSSNHHIFGKVVDGLEVVAAASNHRPITEAIVVDCGVVPYGCSAPPPHHYRGDWCCGSSAPSPPPSPQGM